MFQIDSLTDDATQAMEIRLSDGTSFTLTLYYKPTIQRWMFDCSYLNWSANGQGLCVHPNILRNWLNIIPFGLAITSSDKADPFNLEDFLNGRISIYVLDNTADNNDVDQVEQQIFGKVV